MDLSEYSTDDLHDLAEQVQQEIERREVEESIPQQIDHLLDHAVRVRGHEQEDEWQHPGATGFPLGWVTRRKGRRYESLISNNVWEPGDPDDPQNYRWWKDLTAEEEQGDTEWSGASVEYFPGDERTYEGQWYRARQHHVSQPDWTPPVVPALWEPIEGSSDG